MTLLYLSGISHFFWQNLLLQKKNLFWTEVYLLISHHSDYFLFQLSFCWLVRCHFFYIQSISFLSWLLSLLPSFLPGALGSHRSTPPPPTTQPQLFCLPLIFPCSEDPLPELVARSIFWRSALTIPLRCSQIFNVSPLPVEWCPHALNPIADLNGFLIIHYTQPDAGHNEL